MRYLLLTIALLLASLTCYADDAVQITFDPSWDLWPKWSPDSTTIAFSSERYGSWDVFTIPASGGSATRLTSDTGGETTPEWSPDGAIIVYSNASPEELYKIPSTGGTPTRFTYNSFSDFCPNWSSDDTRIAFHGYYTKSGEKQSDNSIFWIPADDGTATPNLIISGRDNTWPDWAPNNSNLITFSRDDLDIWTMVLGGSAYNVTDDPYNDNYSTWSPGGQYLTFGSDRSGNWDIWIIPATGGTPIQVTDDPATDGGPVWSPNGDKIAFTSTRSGNYDIYVIDVSDLVNIESASLGEIKAHFATEEMKEK